MGKQKKERAATPPYAAAAQEVATESSEQPTEILSQDCGSVNEGKGQGVELTVDEDDICISFVNADVEIINEACDEGELSAYETFYVTFIPTKGPTLGLTLSRDQIQILNKIYGDYLEASEINRRLVRSHRVKARKWEGNE